MIMDHLPPKETNPVYFTVSPIVLIGDEEKLFPLFFFLLRSFNSSLFFSLFFTQFTTVSV